MTKADLVERVTAQISRTAGPMISKKDCARVVDAFLEAIKESLQTQENIEVRGFGTFKIPLEPGGTVGDLVRRIRSLPAAYALPESLRVAVNRKFATHDQLVGEMDEVALIPPVAGG